MAAEEKETNSNARVKAAAWTAGVTGVFVLLAMSDSPTWPEAVIMLGVLGMVSVVCYLILQYR